MLEVKNVKVEYYGEEVGTLNFAFNQGVTLILGEVGSFKTTLFRVLGGIKEFDEGEIILDGERIEELPPKKRDMAYVGLDSTPTSGNVVKALMQPLRLRGVSKKEAFVAADGAAQKFGLDSKRKIKALSKAELVSFFKARLSLRNIAVTMFDEPYHYFGTENAQSITDMIKSCGGYVLVSSCDGGDIERLKPDYLIVVRGDNLLQQGKTEELIGSPASKYIEMFVK
ncbi:MAG: ABC transporter ATP-binding protein [Clostridiales bacterium]|nr:ABC transporter ATP-binding protein [Clostridiales bacterium]